jgi:hypothetical protein
MLQEEEEKETQLPEIDEESVEIPTKVVED